MSTPGALFRPYDKLVKITVKGREVEVPDNNMVLRALQYVAQENIAYGRFCWNEECQYCRIEYDMGEGTSTHTAISCKLMVKPGMRITQMDTELRYCLRDVEGAEKKNP
jgi:NADH dehydrogenase/NADH:ubiquinone oxidoreductase subunit G